MYKTKQCERCGAEFQPVSARQRFCISCKEPHKLEKAKETHHRYYLEHRMLTGYNQRGKNNNAYKNGTGIDWYREALEILPERCNRCGCSPDYYQGEIRRVRKLVLHHKNGIHDDNRPENWEILCKRCHQRHHCIRDPETGRFVKGKG